MVRARREYEGSLFAWLGCAIIAYMPFTGRVRSPAAVNPYGDGGPSSSSRDVIRRVNRMRRRAFILAEFERAGKEV